VRPWQQVDLPWDWRHEFPFAGPGEVFENKEARTLSTQGLTACIRRSAASAAAVRGSGADAGAVAEFEESSTV